MDGWDGSRFWVTAGSFDSLGPAVHTARLSSGHHVRYLDDGPRDELVAVFFGGAGTSVRAFRLLEFMRTLRYELGIRVVAVERNGLGLTPFDPACGPAEHADDVGEVLDLLEVDAFAVVAISGGGPYAARLLARRPESVTSVHLACALSDHRAQSPLDVHLSTVWADPVGWWTFPDSSAVHRIPGFVESAAEEATHALWGRGPEATSAGLEQAIEIYRHEELPELTTMRAPTFLYWGAADEVVSPAHLRRWQEVLATPAVVRLYPGEGHDVQYRHWDQILCDVRYQGERTVLSRDGRTWLAPEAEVPAALAEDATLGLAAWALSR